MPVSVKTGDVAPDSTTTNDCEALDEKNQEARGKLTENLTTKALTKNTKKRKRNGPMEPIGDSEPIGGSLTQKEHDVLDKATMHGMTFSSATVKIDNKNMSYTACSAGMAHEKEPSSVCQGGSKGHFEGEIGVLCEESNSGGSYKHVKGGFGAHAEAKIVNEVTGVVGPKKMKGGSMLFSIDWRSADYGRSGMPCALCFKMLCHAAKECNILIQICNHEKEPVELSKGNCDDKDGYANLCERVDGGPKPGR